MNFVRLVERGADRVERIELALLPPGGLAGNDHFLSGIFLRWPEISDFLVQNIKKIWS